MISSGMEKVALCRDAATMAGRAVRCPPTARNAGQHWAAPPVYWLMPCKSVPNWAMNAGVMIWSSWILAKVAGLLATP